MNIGMSRTVSRGLKASLLAATVLWGAPALAQEADKAAELETVVVTGKRLSEASVAIGTDHATATVSITREALLSAPAGVTGLKMLESLPGFNVQANDALGMYEFGNSVSVRAFNFQQIGFLLDNIPMGRSDQFGGSPIYRYVDNENLPRHRLGRGRRRRPAQLRLAGSDRRLLHPGPSRPPAARQPDLRQRQPAPHLPAAGVGQGRPAVGLCQRLVDQGRPVARPRHDRSQALRGQAEVRAAQRRRHQLPDRPQRLFRL
jgi:hypothetical protein